MKIAYNPIGLGALSKAPITLKNDIVFDLVGKKIFAKDVEFKGTDTVYSVFKKDTSNTGGGWNGLVPKPNYNSDSTTRYLREDGIWVIPTDNKVLQSKSTTENFRPIILGADYDADKNSIHNSTTSLVYTAANIYVQPSTGNLYATTFIGNLTGTADIAKSVDWANVKNKPKTFPSSPHKHDYLSGWLDTRNDKTTPNDYNGLFKVTGLKYSKTLELTEDSTYVSTLGFRGWNDSTGGVTHELAFVGNGALYRRFGSTTDWDSGWIEFIDSSNYKNYTVTKTGLGASGNWNITASNADKLDGHDSSEFLFKKDVLNDNLIIINKNLKLTVNWQDTGIVLNSDTFPLGKGSYLVQISRGSLYIWTGYCTLNIDSKASNNYSDEILLHGGGSDSDSQPYLRTINDKTNNNVKILMAYTKDMATSEEWIFKFKRLI